MDMRGEHRYCHFKHLPAMISPRSQGRHRPRDEKFYMAIRPAEAIRSLGHEVRVDLTYMKRAMDVCLFLSAAAVALINEPSPIGQLAGSIFIMAALFHSFKYLRKPLFFSVVSSGIGFAFELISLFVSLPFGHYKYIDGTLGFMVLGVLPLAIPFLWFALGYLALHIGLSITPTWRWVPISACALMSFDVMLEPLASGKLWVWTAPVGPFGVPPTNFIGWFLVAATFYFLYHLRGTSQDEISSSAIMVFMLISGSCAIVSIMRGIWLSALFGLVPITAISIYALSRIKNMPAANSFPLRVH